MENADMDIDMDIDLGPVDAAVSLLPTLDSIPNSNLTPDLEQRPSQVTHQEITTPHKVHIRGVDDLTTDDIRAFSVQHFPSDAPARIEWIDDTSANIVYSTPSTGLLALEHLSLSLSTSTQLTELRPAKTDSVHPGSQLQVRTALTSDQKRPRAHEASRFYMMHPEHDPKERRRRNRSHLGDEEYHRRRYGDDEDRKRRRKDKEDGFDASMYDDDNVSSGRRGSGASSQGSRTRHLVDSYRPQRNGKNHSRDRSASPDQRNDNGPRRRIRTPPPSYQRDDPHPFPSKNEGKELFPTVSNRVGKKVGMDLINNTSLVVESKKELFPHKANTVLHRRSDAFDAADETADLFASGMSVPFTDSPRRGAVKGLASKITAPSESTYGRLRSSDLDPTMDEEAGDGVTIRCASKQDQGFSIRGGAAATTTELFPRKIAGNTGKELFAEKLEGRGMRRTRAEDMFY